MPPSWDKARPPEMLAKADDQRLEAALAVAGRDGRVLAFGSFHVVAALLR